MSTRIAVALVVCLVASAGEISAQVVQLPTFQSFSISTTVSVPDRGAAYLGGVSRAAYGSTSRGVPGLGQVPFAGRLFRNRGIGSSVSSSGAWATATIIDQQEMDAQLLAEAAALRGERVAVTETERKAAFLASNVGRRTEDVTVPAAESFEPLDHNTTATRIADAEREHAEQIAVYLERGQRAEVAGKFGAARCSYDIVRRRGNAEQRALAETRLAALAVAESGVSLAAHRD